jgi:hypothetical protein
MYSIACAGTNRGDMLQGLATDVTPASHSPSDRHHRRWSANRSLIDQSPVVTDLAFSYGPEFLHALIGHHLYGSALGSAASQARRCYEL